MSSQIFWITYVAVWSLILALFFAVFLLFRAQRQIILSIRNEKLEGQGPQVNQKLPEIVLYDLRGNAIRLGRPQPKTQFIFFSSPGCKHCRRIRGAFGAFADFNAATVEALLVCRGESKLVAEFAKGLPQSVNVIADPHWEIGKQLNVLGVPFGLIVDFEAVVKVKRMLDDLKSPGQLNKLLTDK
jgi:AhpC/TSA family protein